MPKTHRLLCVATVLLFLAGCNPEEMVKKVASAEDQQVATECINALLQRRFVALENTLAEGLRGPETRATLERMANALPVGKPDAVKLIGADIKMTGGARTSDITYQYSYGKRHFMVNCATWTDANSREIVALNVQELEFSIDEQAGFSLKNKAPGQIALLIAGIVFMATTLAALVLCVMEKGLQRKWMWIVFVLVGFGKLSVNWNSGAWDFSPASVMLFSVSAVSRGYGGWVISIALPVGAAVYLLRRFLNHRSAAVSKDGLSPNQ